MDVVEEGAAIPNGVEAAKAGPVAPQPNVLGVAWRVNEGITVEPFVRKRHGRRFVWGFGKGIGVGMVGGAAPGPSERFGGVAPSPNAPPGEEPLLGAAKEATAGKVGRPESREDGRIGGDAPDVDEGAVVRAEGADVFPGGHGNNGLVPHRLFEWSEISFQASMAREGRKARNSAFYRDLTWV